MTTEATTEVTKAETEETASAPCYFIAKVAHEFASKRDAEKFLASQGGLHEGESLVRGKYLDVSEAKVYQIS